MPKPGIATIALRKYDVFTAVRMAADAGFLGVEVWGKPPHVPDPVDWAHVASMADAVQQAGLVTAMFGSYVNVADDGWQSKAADGLRVCRSLNAPVMRIWVGNTEPQDADEGFWQEMVSRVRAFCVMAENEGVVLAVEMHAGTLAADIAGNERLLGEVEHPALKLNFQLTDHEPHYFDRALPALGPHIVSIHAHNYHKVIEDGKESYELTWLDEGEVDYADLLRRLGEHSFDGFIEVEFLKGESRGEGALLESLKRDADYLRCICGL